MVVVVEVGEEEVRVGRGAETVGGHGRRGGKGDPRGVRGGKGRGSR